MRAHELLPRTTVAEVVAALGSAAACQAFADEVGVSLTEEARIHIDGLVTTVVMRWRVTTDGFTLPPIVARVLPADVELHWEQRLTLQDDDRATGTVTVQSSGSPSARFSGTATLIAADDAVSYTVDGSSRVDVPFIGGTLAGLVDEHLVADVLLDQSVALRRVLAGTA